MSNPVRFLGDVGLWVVCIVATGVMRGAGLIDDPAFALAGSALFLAIRANSKAEVNTAHKISEVQ